jgi:hypothetical protein
MRILIVEEALRLGNGHWPRYIADLAEGFRAAGDYVDVLGHKEVNQKVRTVVQGVVPWLSRDCRADARSQGLIGGIRHNLCLKRELLAWLKGRDSYDWILSLSSRPKHLLAFAILSRAGYCARSRFLLLFVISPGQQDEAGKFRLSASNLFAKFCFALLRPAVCRGQVVIAAETKEMQAEIERFSDLRTVLFPHPVELPAELLQGKAETLKSEILKKKQPEDRLGTTNDTNQHETLTMDGSDRHGCGAGLRLAGQAGAAFSNPSASELARDSENAALTRSASIPASALDAGLSTLDSKAPATSHSLLATAPEALALDLPARPVLVVAPGLARYEKGSDMMQAAIRLLLQKAETLKSEKLKEGCSAPKDRRSEIGDRGLRESSNLVPSSATTGGRTLKFVMQWLEDFDLPDGRRCAPDPDLLKDERVKFSKDLLTGEAYWDFLRQADVVVLPYRSESYRARVSRVAIEAAILGKPMVYSKDTWISEVVAMGAAGVAIAEETPQSLAEAIQMAIGDLDMLQSEAECGVARVRNFYSVSAFHHLLGEVGGNKKSNIAE